MFKQLLIDKCKEYGLLRNQAAYVLATVQWETGQTYQPVRETFASSDQQAINRLENAWKKGQLTWVKTPYWRDGWFGRGFVQLTHRDNYKRAGDKLGINLVSDPSKALDPITSAHITVRGMKEGWFTGKKLSDYITLQSSDFFNARRIVNGTDRAREIEAMAKVWDADLLAQGYGVETPLESTEKPTDGSKLTIRWEVLGSILLALLGALSSFLFRRR